MKILATLQRALILGLLSAVMIHEFMTIPLLDVAGKSEEKAKTNELETLHLSKHYSSLKEQDDRDIRFPSVLERVQFYMGSWFVPPCSGNHEAMAAYRRLEDNRILVREIQSSELPNPRIFVLATNKSQTNRAFAIDRDKLHRKCDKKYCADTVQHLVPAMHRVDNEIGEPDDTPFIMFYSDAQVTQGYTNLGMRATDYSMQMPIFKKFRLSFGGMDKIEEITSTRCIEGERPYPRTEIEIPNLKRYQDIILRLGSIRHYDPIPFIASLDTPWEKKENIASFRGTLTGERNDFDHTDKERLKMSDLDRCLNLPRCRLVYNTANSTIVDAKLTETGDKVPPQINGVDLVGEFFDYKQALSSKGIIMVEGNDISTGFKWALHSKSVVLTQKPTKSSWMMEELLLPWVHYIPLNDELTDVEEKMQWVLDHDEEAQEIAHRGSLWIKDLLFHPVAERESAKVNDEMVRRYRAHFYEDKNLTLPS